MERTFSSFAPGSTQQRRSVDTHQLKPQNEHLTELSPFEYFPIGEKSLELGREAVHGFQQAYLLPLGA